MIHYLATRRHRYTVESYLRVWEPSLRDRIKVVAYESLPGRTALPAGTYIFSDLERLTSSELAMAAGVADQLAAARPELRILNHPRHVLLRYDLLRTLKQRGLNDFAAFRVEDAQRANFPVFVRHEHTHVGSLTPPIETVAEVRSAVHTLVRRGADPARLLAVEFCDTADAGGVYRKYSAFMIGDQVIPRHEIFGRTWVMKLPMLDNDALLAEEREYLDRNPHAAWIRSVFSVAGIQYGRMDYGVKDGRPQAWEINTNPMILLAPNRYASRHLPQQQRFARLLPAAFDAIDRHGSDAEPPIAVSIEAPDPRPRRWGLRRLVRRMRRVAARRLR